MNAASRKAKVQAASQETGMSLVEVLIALGIMAGVLISVASLFVLGGQRVKGGRNMTQALAAAGDIVEAIHDIGFNTLAESMPSCCGTGCDTSTGCTVDTRTDSYALAEWQPWLDQELFQAYGAITLTPIGGATTPPNFLSAEAVQVHIQVFWNEGTSQRSVVEETLLF